MTLAAAAPARRFPRLICLLVVVCSDGRALAAGEQDQYEEKTVSRCAERAARIAKSDRVLWVKELEEAYPDKVGNPLKEEEYAAWFTLLAGDAAEWRRATAANARIAELFDRVLQRLELGPVPSIKRDEFMRYARKVLVQGNPQAQGQNDPNEDADKVFRVLDIDGDGMLVPEELTTKLRDERPRADVNGNGRIDKDEYRTYFQRRVTVSAEVAVKAMEQNGRGSDPKIPNRPGSTLPTWFTDVDTDKDGQVALSEWRKAGRAIAVFQEMDLDGDGLLTKEEYARFARMKEKENMPPPPNPDAGKPGKM